MGIVIAIIMALGLLGFLLRQHPRVIRVISVLLGAGALWNIFWYGLFHINAFWGQAAVISGVVMGISALTLRGTRSLLPTPVVILILLACFALYTTALIRLNLGLSIPS